VKIHKRVKVLGETYKIMFIKDLVDKDGKICDGLTTFDPKIIHIMKDLNDEDTMETLFHEINHAILFESGVVQGNLSDDLEEVIVQQIAKCYNSIFDLSFKKRKRIKKV
jgi:hypothetical protein